MASSRKPPSAERIAVALSGGVDSVVLLHSLRERPGVFAVHVHHGLSPNADAWASFCRKLCKQWNVPLKIHRVRVVRKGRGLEAAARAARHFAAKNLDARLLLREFLAERGLRAPSEAKLSEMLKQLTAQGSRTLIEHDGVRLRLFRGKVFVANEPAGEGDIRFRPARGKGIDAELAKKGFTVRQRSGGEKLQ